MPALADARRARADGRRQPFAVVAKRRDTADTWTLELEARDGDAAAVRARPVHDARGRRGGRGADLDQRRPGRRRARSSTRCAPSAWRPQAICAAEPGAGARRARARSATAWPVAEMRGRRCRHRRRRHRARAAAPGDPALLGDASATAGSCCSTAGARPISCSTSRRARGVGAARARGARHGRQRRTGMARPRRRRHAADAAAPAIDGTRTVALLCGPEVMMRFAVAALREPAASRAERIVRLDGAQHAVRDRPLRPLPARTDARLPRRPGLPLGRARAAGSRSGSCDGATGKPDARGVEVRLLRRLPAQPARPARTSCSRSPSEIEIAYFLEASSATVEGPYDVSLVEGSITTPHDAERIHEVRAPARAALITIGACATAGGIQALRNFADVDGLHAGRLRLARLHLDAAPPRRRSAPHVPVDFELHGCPINKHQLLEVISAHLQPAPAARPRAQRLRRVQAARHRVRDGRPRHRRAWAR